jgi:hypothetical protein
VPFKKEHLRKDYVIPIPENLLEEEEATSNILINRMFFPFELEEQASNLRSRRSKQDS